MRFIIVGSLLWLGGCAVEVGQPIDCGDTGEEMGTPLEACMPAGRGTCPDAAEALECPDAPNRIIYSSLQIDIVEERADVITDQDAYDELDAALSDMLLPDVDFSANQILVAATGNGGTCGLREAVVRVMTWEDKPHLDVVVEDVSGGCDAGCDETSYLLTIVQVPRSSLGATVCARKRDVCCDKTSPEAACPPTGE